jgi:hypothetical protein
MTARLNTSNLLWVIGVLQPVSVEEITGYLSAVFDDAGAMPRVADIQKFCLEQTDQKHLVRVARDPDLFSLTLLGNQYLPESLRKSRDKSRIYLLRGAHKAKIRTSRGVEALGLDGVAPSEDVRLTLKGTEANKLVPVVPSGQSYWPRFSKQLSEQTGSLPASRDTQLPLLSYANREQLALSMRSKSDAESLSFTSLGLMLGISPKLIQQIAGNTDRHYRSFLLNKSTGGTRQIDSPRVFLKVIQRFLLDYILFELPVDNRVFSFRSNKSIADNASLHTGKPFVGNIDIKDFFGSITEKNVSDFLRSCKIESRGAGLISALVTKGGVLPQGAVTSPIISNSILHKFDYRMSYFASQSGADYSRYADDITFSGKDRDIIANLINVAEKDLVRDYGLTLNKAKTRISTQRSQQKVTGLVVNEKVWPPRKFRRQIRAAFFNASQQSDIPREHALKLSGYLSYLRSFEAMKNLDELARYAAIISRVPVKLTD